MELNLPIPAYYARDFIDPLYLPYKRRLAPGKIQSTGREVGVNISPYTLKADPLYSQPLLERKGWSLSFQRMFDYDPCPAGWTPGEDGWCFQTEPEDDFGIFYTKDAYIPRVQFWGGYSLPHSYDRPLNNFDNRSVSQDTGWHYTTHPSYLDPEVTSYNLSPARDSYVGDFL